MKASEIMTLAVVTVRPEASVKEAASLMWGVIRDERERDVIRVVAENVPCISQVINHLVCFHPMPAGIGLPH
jgi:predicted transcriptional regulator